MASAAKPSMEPPHWFTKWKCRTIATKVFIRSMMAQEAGHFAPVPGPIPPPSLTDLQQQADDTVGRCGAGRIRSVRAAPLRWRSAEYSAANMVKQSLREPSLIYKNRIYLGSAFNASNRNTVNRLQITGLVNVAQEVPSIFKEEGKIECLHKPLYDDMRADALSDEQVTSVADWIKNHLDKDANNKVLVGCVWGASRSATMMAKVLQKLYPDEFPGFWQAVAHIEERRAVLSINLRLLSAEERKVVEDVVRSGD